MSNAINSLQIIHYNPFILAPLFPDFFKKLGEKRNGLLLSYLVLPIVLPPLSRRFLTNAKSTSSLMTLAGKPEERNRLFGLQDRIAEYRSLTNACLQYLLDNELLAITRYLSANADGKTLDALLAPTHSVKSAAKLGQLFAPYDVPTIFRTLGIKLL